MKIGLHVAAVAGLAASLAAVAPAPADAGNGAGVAGFVTGLWVGNALVNPPPPAYYPQPIYVQPAPVYTVRNCLRRERWLDPYAGWVWRDVWVC
jgi:hypothetical protein